VSRQEREGERKCPDTSDEIAIVMRFKKRIPVHVCGSNEIVDNQQASHRPNALSGQEEEPHLNKRRIRSERSLMNIVELLFESFDLKRASEARNEERRKEKERKREREG
jgi:hypothetical protein